VETIKESDWPNCMPKLKPQIMGRLADLMRTIPGVTTAQLKELFANVGAAEPALITTNQAENLVARLKTAIESAKKGNKGELFK
jgi:hypothetical protein